MPVNPPFVDGEIPSAAKWNTVVGEYDRSSSTVDVVSTAAATTVWSVTIVAGHMSTDRMLRGTLLGDYLNNTGGSAQLDISLRFGGAAIMADAFTAIATSANRRPVRVEFEIGNLGVTNAQYAVMQLHIGAAAVSTAGTGDVFADNFVSSFTAATQQHVLMGAAPTVATTSGQTLEFAVAHNSSNANLSFRKRFAMLELV